LQQIGLGDIAAEAHPPPISRRRQIARPRLIISKNSVRKGINQVPVAKRRASASTHPRRIGETYRRRPHPPGAHSATASAGLLSRRATPESARPRNHHNASTRSNTKGPAGNRRSVAQRLRPCAIVTGWRLGRPGTTLPARQGTRSPLRTTASILPGVLHFFATECDKSSQLRSGVSHTPQTDFVDIPNPLDRDDEIRMRAL